MKSFIVLGAGRFGISVATMLFKLGNEVLVIDHDEEKINEITDSVTQAIIGDCCDENLLKSLGVRNFDGAIVAIGGNMESSILATLLLVNLGVKDIVAKAKSAPHAKVLEKVGANKVVLPERDMGVKLAQSLTSKNVLDFIEVSPEYSIIEAAVPIDWVGKTLSQLNVRNKFGVNVLAVKTAEAIMVSLLADYVLSESDLLIAIGSNKDLDKIR